MIVLGQIKWNCMFYLRLLIIGILAIQSCEQSPNTDVVSQSPNWIRIGPGGGGSTFIPTFSYSNTDKFLVRCDMTGAYLTNDGGDSFALINYPNGSQSFAYDPMDSLTIYIGSNSLNRSLDGGMSWERILPVKEDIVKEVFQSDHASLKIITKENSLFNISDNSNAVRNIKVDPFDSKSIYFSMGNFFFYTLDGGIKWSKLPLDQEIEFIYTNTTELQNQVYAFTNSGLIVIDKNTWEVSSIGIPELMQPAFSYTGGTIKANGATVFYALHNDESLRIHGGIAPTTVWVSRDLGLTWEQSKDVVISNPENATPTYSTLSAAENDAANVYVVTNSYEEKMKGGSVAHWYGTIKSDDAGKSWAWAWKGGGGSGQYTVKDGKDAQNLKDAWVQKAFGGEYIRLMDVGVAPNNGDIAIVTDWYRLMKTTDGGKSWTSIYSKEQPGGSYISNGLDVTTVYGIHFDPFDNDHIAISYTDIGYHHSYDGGKSWSRSTEGIPVEWHNTCYWMVFDPEVKDKIYAVWSGLHDFPRGKMTRNPNWTRYGKGGVAISLDGGRSWTPKVEGMGFDTPSTSIVLDENSPVGNRTIYVAAFGKGVFKSTDDGQTWGLHNNGITGSLAAFELTIQPDGTLFLVTSATPQHIGGQQGREIFLGAVYKSTDGATSWQRLEVGNKIGFPNGLTFDPQNPKRLYLGSWADINLSDLIGGSLARSTGGNKLIDLDGGIMMSEDGGDTWTQIFDPDHYVYDVTVDPAHPGRVYCNTFDQGAYRSDDYGKTWNKLKDYDFHWGHRVIVDEHDSEKVYLTTYGSSVWHGKP